MKDIEDEIPFEVPEGWAWCRLGEIGNIVTGSTPSKTHSEYYGNEYPFFKPTDLEQGINTIIAEDNLSKIGFLQARQLPKDSILVTCIGATIGKTGLIKTVGTCNQQINAIIPNNSILPIFLFFSCLSDFMQESIISNSSSTTLPILNKSKFASLLLPLPPIEEQSRIIDTLKIIFAQIMTVEQNKSNLKLLIKQAKSKILDLAIHGKLVPQDFSDEPASVLLEKLRAEKEAKIKAGELKRDKNDSFIYKNTTDNCYYEKFNGKEAVCIDEEIPFDIPKEWTWCRLSELAELKGGKRIPAGMSATKDKTDHIYIRVSDMKNDTITTDDLHYISDTIFEQIKQYIIGKDDLYLTIAGTIGRVGEVPELFDKMNLTENALKITNININKKYLLIVLKSPYVQDYFASTYHQVAMPKLSLTNASKTIIPLPPISEQKRIVSKSEEMFERLDQIQNNLI